MARFAGVHLFKSIIIKAYAEHGSNFFNSKSTLSITG